MINFFFLFLDLGQLLQPLLGDGDTRAGDVATIHYKDPDYGANHLPLGPDHRTNARQRYHGGLQRHSQSPIRACRSQSIHC